MTVLQKIRRKVHNTPAPELEKLLRENRKQRKLIDEKMGGNDGVARGTIFSLLSREEHERKAD